MALKTLKTVLLKTVSVSVKLPTPADRIGLGLVAATTHPAEFLSRGRIPSPPNPAPEPYSGPRQESTAMRMREQTRAVATAAAPAGSAGCPVPGSSARRPVPSFSRPSLGWRVTAKWAPATGRLVTATAGLTGTGTTTPVGGGSRTGFPGFSGLRNRIGRDCQSPDRNDDRRNPDASLSAGRHSAAWEAGRFTAAGK
jgi:hypothetical protein